MIRNVLKLVQNKSTRNKTKACISQFQVASMNNIWIKPQTKMHAHTTCLKGNLLVL